MRTKPLSGDFEPAAYVIFRLLEESHHQHFGEVIVQEFIEGLTLDRLAAGGVTDTRTLYDIALQLVDNVQRLHTAGFIHGDIKCDNMIYGNNGKVYLIDFGCTFNIDWKNGSTYQPSEAALEAAREEDDPCHVTTQIDIDGVAQCIRDHLLTRKASRDLRGTMTLAQIKEHLLSTLNGLQSTQ